MKSVVKAKAKSDSFAALKTEANKDCVAKRNLRWRASCVAIVVLSSYVRGWVVVVSPGAELEAGGGECEEARRKSGWCNVVGW